MCSAVSARIWLCLLSFLVVKITATENIPHKIYPACQNETYKTGSNTVAIIKPSTVSMSVFVPDTVYSVLLPAFSRFRKTLLQIPDFVEDYKENPSNLELQEIETLEIRISSPDVELIHGVDESYDLSIKEGSSIIILSASTIFGVVRGLETLSQLLEFGWLNLENEQIFIIRDIPLSIQDSPAFEYRGLLIDTSRHYLPLSLILANLDVMAMNKMNVLHWHLTDSDSFPYKSKSMPEIAEKGAFHPRMVYTTTDIQAVVHEAYLRGIRVVPEIDMPGHSRSIIHSHPELMSPCYDHPPWIDAPLDPTNQKVYDFVRVIYKDLNELFPDTFVHVGGDEVNLNCWKKSKQIAAWMKQHNMTDAAQLYEYFEMQLLGIVNNLKKTPIVWQEVFNLNLTISQNTIIDVWKGFDQKTIEQATNQSFRVILSGCWYLDHLQDTFENLYKCNPMNFKGNRDLLIGGHASMWGEHVDASNFISRVWPRASATAERLWTGDVSRAKKNVMERINRFRCRMVQQGFAVGPFRRYGFCPHEVPYPHRSTNVEDMVIERTIQ